MLESIHGLPSEIEQKMKDMFAEAEHILGQASAVIKTTLDGKKISFALQHSALGDILNPFERAQSVCFVTKYEHLPILEDINVRQVKDKFYLGNIDFIRHILNEYRAIIINQNDSVYYGKVQRFCHEKLSNRDPSAGLSITVTDEIENDVTNEFRSILDERNKAIKTILRSSEFGYIYNGILQHSDHEHTERFWREYHTGQINYVFLKHALLLEERVFDRE